MGALSEALKTFKPRRAAIKIRRGLLAAVRKSSASGVVIDVGHSRYSLTACALAALALGRGRVRAVYAIAKRSDRRRASKVAAALSGYRLPLQIIDVSAALEKVRRLVTAASARGRGDVSGYVREAIVRYYADVYAMLAVSAATKTDVLLGRHVLFLWADVLLLGGIFATQARALTNYLGLQSVRADERLASEFGLRPAKLDEVLLGIELGWAPEEIAKDADVSNDAVKRVARAVEAAKEAGKARVVYEWKPPAEGLELTTRP